MHKLTKTDLKSLKVLADKLPIVMHNTKEVHIYKGEEILSRGEELPEGVILQPDKKYLYDFPVQIAANHYRRLKKAYQVGGHQGVVAYIQKINDLCAKQANN